MQCAEIDATLDLGSITIKSSKSALQNYAEPLKLINLPENTYDTKFNFLKMSYFFLFF